MSYFTRHHQSPRDDSIPFQSNPFLYAPPALLAPSSCLVWKFGVLLSSLSWYSESANAEAPRPDCADACAAARTASFRASFSASASSKDLANAGPATVAVKNAALNAKPRNARRGVAEGVDSGVAVATTRVARRLERTTGRDVRALVVVKRADIVNGCVWMLPQASC